MTSSNWYEILENEKPYRCKVRNAESVIFKQREFHSKKKNDVFTDYYCFYQRGAYCLCKSCKEGEKKYEKGSCVNCKIQCGVAVRYFKKGWRMKRSGILFEKNKWYWNGKKHKKTCDNFYQPPNFVVPPPLQPPLKTSTKPDFRNCEQEGIPSLRPSRQKPAKLLSQSVEDTNNFQPKPFFIEQFEPSFHGNSQSILSQSTTSFQEPNVESEQHGFGMPERKKRKVDELHHRPGPSEIIGIFPNEGSMTELKKVFVMLSTEDERNFTRFNKFVGGCFFGSNRCPNSSEPMRTDETEGRMENIHTILVMLGREDEFKEYQKATHFVEVVTPERYSGDTRIVDVRLLIVSEIDYENRNSLKFEKELFLRSGFTYTEFSVSQPSPSPIGDIFENDDDFNVINEGEDDDLNGEKDWDFPFRIDGTVYSMITSRSAEFKEEDIWKEILEKKLNVEKKNEFGYSILDVCVLFEKKVLEGLIREHLENCEEEGEGEDDEDTIIRELMKDREKIKEDTSIEKYTEKERTTEIRNDIDASHSHLDVFDYWLFLRNKYGDFELLESEYERLMMELYNKRKSPFEKEICIRFIICKLYYISCCIDTSRVSEDYFDIENDLDWEVKEIYPEICITSIEVWYAKCLFCLCYPNAKNNSETFFKIKKEKKLNFGKKTAWGVFLKIILVENEYRISPEERNRRKYERILKIIQENEEILTKSNKYLHYSTLIHKYRAFYKLGRMRGCRQVVNKMLETFPNQTHSHLCRLDLEFFPHVNYQIHHYGFMGLLGLVKRFAEKYENKFKVFEEVSEKIISINRKFIILRSYIKYFKNEYENGLESMEKFEGLCERRSITRSLHSDDILLRRKLKKKVITENKKVVVQMDEKNYEDQKVVVGRFVQSDLCLKSVKMLAETYLQRGEFDKSLSVCFEFYKMLLSGKYFDKAFGKADWEEKKFRIGKDLSLYSRKDKEVLDVEELIISTMKDIPSVKFPLYVIERNISIYKECPKRKSGDLIVLNDDFRRAVFGSLAIGFYNERMYNKAIRILECLCENWAFIDKGPWGKRRDFLHYILGLVYMEKSKDLISSNSGDGEEEYYINRAIKNFRMSIEVASLRKSKAKYEFKISTEMKSLISVESFAALSRIGECYRLLDDLSKSYISHLQAVSLFKKLVHDVYTNVFLALLSSIFRQEEFVKDLYMKDEKVEYFLRSTRIEYYSRNVRKSYDFFVPLDVGELFRVSKSDLSQILATCYTEDLEAEIEKEFIRYKVSESEKMEKEDQKSRNELIYIGISLDGLFRSTAITLSTNIDPRKNKKILIPSILLIQF